jgi:SPP1 family predicted phage head-tail adaptor
MASRINAGELRHLVIWERNFPASTDDSGGQELDNWQTLGTHFAKVEPLTGRELWNARQIKATSTMRITMRDVGDVIASDRFLLDSTSRVLEIDWVSRPEEIESDLIINATELKSPQ